MRSISCERLRLGMTSFHAVTANTMKSRQIEYANVAVSTEALVCDTEHPAPGTQYADTTTPESFVYDTVSFGGTLKHTLHKNGPVPQYQDDKWNHNVKALAPNDHTYRQKISQITNEFTRETHARIAKLILANPIVTWPAI